LDLLFKQRQDYERVKKSGKVSKETIADLYRVQQNQVLDVIFYDPGMAVKITLVRPRVAGDLGDGDVYGCQQHAPLLAFRIDL
jgi:hypothetical protein